MNVRLCKQYEWTSGLVWNGEFLINSYLANVRMITHTMNTDWQNQAYQRINYWMYQVMQDSVLIAQNDDLMEPYRSTGQRLIVFPEQPVDQLLGMLLFCKLNAVMEDRMQVLELEISSTVGDRMIYLHSQNEDLGPFSAAGWWSDPRPRWTDSKYRGSAGNVISIDRVPEWKDLDLDWAQHEVSAEAGVVFASFKKDETE
jgi:hypothetical protein